MAGMSPLAAGPVRKPLATDAMGPGVHSDLRQVSKHRKMVSAPLLLKKESAGHKSKPSAYNSGTKGFQRR